MHASCLLISDYQIKDKRVPYSGRYVRSPVGLLLQMSACMLFIYNFTLARSLAAVSQQFGQMKNVRNNYLMPLNP